MWRSLLLCLLLSLHCVFTLEMPSSISPSDPTTDRNDSEHRDGQLPDIFRKVRPSNWESGSLVVLPLETHHKSWLQWWDQTEYRRQHEIKIDWLLKKMTHEVWEDLVPVADVKTGKPWVLCRRCSQVLAHPSLKNAGTSSLKKHLLSEGCKNGARRQAKQQAKQQAESSSSGTGPSTIPALFTSQSARVARKHVSYSHILLVY